MVSHSRSYSGSIPAGPPLVFFFHVFTPNHAVNPPLFSHNFLIPEMPQTILDAVNQTLSSAQLVFDSCTRTIPGSWQILRYIQKSYQDDPARVVLEVLLVIFLVRYMLSKKYNPDSRDVKLTTKVSASQ
jgi:hypothetical protein